MIAYSQTTLVLTLFLTAFPTVSESQVGLFMTLTLVGDVAISYYLTWYADNIGRRNVMLLGAFLMFISGLIFYFSDNFWILLIAATIGVISPSGDETGPFKSVEEAAIAHLTIYELRADVYAWYNLSGTIGGAIGSLSGGWILQLLQNRSWSSDNSYRFIFLLYSAIAAIKFITMLFLSANCELDAEDNEIEGNSNINVITATESSISDAYVYSSSTTYDRREAPIVDETQALLPKKSSEAVTGTNTTAQEIRDNINVPILGLSPETKRTVFRLSILFFLDSLGYGVIPQSWVVYFFKIKFDASAGALGTIFFSTNILDACTSLPSSYLTKKIGPVKATIFTHAPSNIFRALISSTSSLPLSLTFLLLNSSLSTMDVVPRQVLMTTLVKKNELTKVLGIVNIVKTFARCIGPLLTGRLAESGRLAIAFPIGGLFSILLDVGMGLFFWDIDQRSR